MQNVREDAQARTQAAREEAKALNQIPDSSAALDANAAASAQDISGF
ncbi:MAG: hypothetical protein AAB830_01145 [Patescibacteria group bacterium]